MATKSNSGRAGFLMFATANTFKIIIIISRIFNFEELLSTDDYYEKFVYQNLEVSHVAMIALSN
jgi:hypothetical protein